MTDTCKIQPYLHFKSKNNFIQVLSHNIASGSDVTP